MKIKLTDPSSTNQLGPVSRTLGGAGLNLLESLEGLGKGFNQDPYQFLRPEIAAQMPKQRPLSQVLLNQIEQPRESFYHKI